MKSFSISHGLTDTFTPIFSCLKEEVVYRGETDLDSNCRRLNESENHLFQKHCPARVATSSFHGNQTPSGPWKLLTCGCHFWIFHAGPALKHSVMLFLANRSPGRRSWWNADVGLITCVRGPVCHSARLRKCSAQVQR